MLPSLFIAHGSPLLAIEENPYTTFLHDLGQTFSRVRAIVIFSAHWTAAPQQIGNVDRYETLYDFGGFPETLYRLTYPARGNPEVVKELEALLSQNNVPYRLDARRGLDHGAWVVLRLLFPAADIPVVAMSVDPRLPPQEQYRIGRALSPLRATDTLIIGSGGTVHNLRAFSMARGDSPPDSWAVDFEDWLEARLNRWDLGALFNYPQLAPHADWAVPAFGSEHFAPLVYAMGAADDEQTAERLHLSFRYGNLSHAVWRFGTS